MSTATSEELRCVIADLISEAKELRTENARLRAELEAVGAGGVQPLAPQQAALTPRQVTADQRVEWLLDVQPVADIDGLGHFVTAWLTESRSPTGVAGYFTTRGKTHIECVDLHIMGQGKEAQE